MYLMKNKYPIYIISLGRWDSRMTSRALDEINASYKIVIEPKEFDLYAKFIDKNKIIVLPDNFSELGQGSIPARNFVWEYAINEGFERHWILDDNIGSFRRLNRNLQIKVSDTTIFRCAEDFVDRYTNIAIAGFQYDYFLPSKYKFPPLVFNTRIYSCLLIDNNINYRWRGKYNEDTDLCLRVLKDGFCTVLFNAFIQEKKETGSLKGGNTDTIYNTDDKRLEFAESLVKLHPDVAKVTWKYNRWHHQVNYKPFKTNKLIRKQGIDIKDGVNNYGMVLKTISK